MVEKTEQRFAAVAVVIIVLITTAIIASLVLIHTQRAKPLPAAKSQIASVNMSGTVTLGTTTPTCNNEQSCNSPVGNHTIEAIDASNNVVATTKTDSAGTYSFRLIPGHYTLKLVPQVGPFAATNDKVDITGSSKKFDITIDSGIR